MKKVGVEMDANTIPIPGHDRASQVYHEENVRPGYTSDCPVESSHPGEKFTDSAGASLDELANACTSEAQPERVVSSGIGRLIAQTIEHTRKQCAALIGDRVRSMARIVGEQVARAQNAIAATALRGQQALFATQQFAFRVSERAKEWFAPHANHFRDWWYRSLCWLAMAAVRYGDMDFLRWFRTDVLGLSARYEPFVALVLWERRWPVAEDPVRYLTKAAVYASRDEYRKRGRSMFFTRQEVIVDQSPSDVEPRRATSKAVEELLPFSQPVTTNSDGELELLDTLTADDNSIANSETRMLAASILERLDEDVRTLVVAKAASGCSLRELPKLLGWSAQKVGATHRRLARARPQLLQEFGFSA